MEQHPVPQNISSYQFHLVGDMTLKQFLELAGGVVVGIVFYATGLPNLIKWPLILFSAGLGAALAFVPFEERPLEQWIYAFIRSVYSPTLFHWEKLPDVKYFADESAPTTPASPTVSKFANIPFLNKLEEGEISYLSKLTGMFNPSVTPMASQQPIAQHQPVVQTVQQQTQPQVIADTSRPTMVTASMNSNQNGQVLTMHSVNPVSNIPTGSAPVKADLQIPRTTYISIDKPQTARPQMQVMETGQVNAPAKIDTVKLGPAFNPQVVTNAHQANFSPDAAPPSDPTIINTVSGQVMDANKKILEGAILEIIDQSGRAVRALRTNKAGHFLIVTPLADGKYKILTDKANNAFDPIEFEANGGIIAPIAITAKAQI